MITKTYLKFRSRITVISLLVILSWAGLSARFFQIQVLNGNTYRTQGKKQGEAQKTLLANRGNIFDRKNTPLTRNIIHYNLAVHPSKIQDKISLAETIHNCTNRPIDHYTKMMNTGKSFVYLERNLSKETCSNLIKNPVAGLILERKTRRSYTHGRIAAQIIGCTDVDDKGLTGIEKKFDHLLKGTSGWIIKQRNGLGDLNPKNSFPTKPPIDGSNIQLTIDLDYQCILQEELARRMEQTGAVGATGLLMNPHTGAILAMASLPDFDPNHPENSKTEYQKIKSITDQFEPGSTFKIVAATAAVELKTVPPEQEFNCENGSYLYNNLLIIDHEEFGLLNFSQIVANSSNVGIIKISETLGQNNLHRFARQYGFGSLTNINLMGEVSGTLRKTQDWSRISLAQIARGYEVGVTAIQLASAFAVVANGGFLIRPIIINQIIDAKGNRRYSEESEIIRKVASPDAMNTLKEMLVKTVESGTGIEARIPGWNVAGKTGTAQKFIDGEYSTTKFVSNFVGFFPADNPQLLGLILLDEPKIGYHWGGVGAAPTFKKIMERIINIDDSIKRKIRPTQPDKEGSFLVKNPSPVFVKNEVNIPVPLGKNQIVRTDKIIIPDVRNMSLLKAMNTLKIYGLRTKINGSGKVIWQSPKPGTKITAGSICSIGLK